MKYLNLNSSDKIAIETYAMLNYKHMYAALKILKKQIKTLIIVIINNQNLSRHGGELGPQEISY